jgi:hypothetical protein
MIYQLAMMLAVSSLQREFSGANHFYHTLTVNHELSDPKRKAREENPQVYDFLHTPV